MICRKVKANLADLLLDAGSVSSEVRDHLKDCAACRTELASLQATMKLMDDWQAPEPSPYFGSRMSALLREEQRAEPAGFFERIKVRVLYGSNMHLRPVATGALVLLLIVGGGTYAGLMTSSHSTSSVRVSAVVEDLNSLDENAQMLQQLNALDDENQGENSALPDNL
jgi:predicted anti-sigma-YlaC factor YlaD